MLKKMFALAMAGTALLALSVLAGGAASKTSSSGAAAAEITLGFSQVGSESGWRAANTKSIQSVRQGSRDHPEVLRRTAEAAEPDRGDPLLHPAEVDVIAFSPVVASGWDSVLREAKRAKIPVVLTDRAVDSKDTTLYKTFIGSDFVKEGRLAGAWVVNAVQGGEGAGQHRRAPGHDGLVTGDRPEERLRERDQGQPNLKIIASQTGEFTRAKGKEVMTAFLKANPKIDLLFAHNDDMGLGAIEAIEAAGLKPGKDIKIVTIDAVHDGMVALAARQDQLHRRVQPAARAATDGTGQAGRGRQAVPRRIVTKETTFNQVAGEGGTAHAQVLVHRADRSGRAGSC